MSISAGNVGRRKVLLPIRPRSMQCRVAICWGAGQCAVVSRKSFGRPGRARLPVVQSNVLIRYLFIVDNAW